ncbi:helix-turn-helix domain-containing protein [Kitasatospora sp. NPDC088134]|uniref:helix-turn-helix domain-containing protein n=1 Tax=Kitasatospora sp. NPDC088134 TaxID=3364071 RepID=UPI003809D935
MGVLGCFAGASRRDDPAARARQDPEERAEAGLPAGPRRRVPGLRRSEVAALADVSVEYYAKLERGHLAGVSPAVLESVARALQLDDAERAHLLHLAQAADGSDALTRPRRRPGRGWTPPPGLQWTLDAITGGPAFVRNGRADLVATNALARSFYCDLFREPGVPGGAVAGEQPDGGAGGGARPSAGDGGGVRPGGGGGGGGGAARPGGGQPPNLARYQFLDPASRAFYPDWSVAADITVAILRTEAGRDPHDRGLHDLIGELSTRSDEFRVRWGAHDVRHHGSGTKHFHHPRVGDLTLSYQGLQLAAEPDLFFTVYTAEPGSASERSLRLLAAPATTGLSAVSP